MKNLTIASIMTLVLLGFAPTTASADGFSTGLFWKGGKPEVIASSQIGAQYADFFFDYRFRVLNSFLPEDVEARLNYLILTYYYNPSEPDAYGKIKRLLAPYDVRIQVLRGRRTLAECRNKYVSFSVSVDEKTGEAKNAQISPGTASVGSEHGKISRLDSAICVKPGTRKNIIPAVKRNDSVSLVYGANATKIATARFKNYPFM